MQYATKTGYGAEPCGVLGLGNKTGHGSIGVPTNEQCGQQKRQPGVEIAMHELAISVDGLEHQFEQLVQRLTWVCSPKPCDPNKAMELPDAASPLAGMIQGHQVRIGRIRSGLIDLIDSLEI